MDDFVVDLYQLAEYCNYGTLHDKLIRDRIVVGLRSAALSEKLQRDADLTLEKAIQMAREHESFRKQQTLLIKDFQEDRAGTLERQSELYIMLRDLKFRGNPKSAPTTQQQKSKKCL